MPRLPRDLTQVRMLLEQELLARGAAAVRVARPDGGSAYLRRSPGWALSGLEYLQRTWFLRQDVRRLWPGVSSVVCVAFPYPVTEVAPRVIRTETGSRPLGVVASYARGRDYHRVLPRILAEAAQAVQARLGLRFGWHVAADSLPVAERALAASCGLGWVGRSGLLVVPGVGPAVLLGELALEVPLPPDEPLPEPGCGMCRACLDACPSGALDSNGFRPERCISYWTTQHRGPVAGEMALRFGGRFFGCDACIVACPQGRAHTETETRPGEVASAHVDLGWVLEASSRELRRRFAATALSFLRPDELRRNALAALASLPELPLADKVALLERVAAGSRPLVRAQAAELLDCLGQGPS